MKKRVAFTLSEVLIVLVIIGVLTAILMPVAFQSSPDENALKAKKAISTITTAIRELVNSDKYFANGDLGVKFDGTFLDSDEEGCYFMEALTDIISTKEKSCNINGGAPFVLFHFTMTDDLEQKRRYIDTKCIRYQAQARKGGEGLYIFKTPDNVLFYGPKVIFGLGLAAGDRLVVEIDENGFIQDYAFFCIDVDGIPDNATNAECINECPFAMGVRYDGKIVYGQKAQEWINKSIQKK